MFRIDARGDVHVDLVAHDAGGYVGIFLMLAAQLLELGGLLLGDYRLLLDPADLTLRGLDLYPVAGVVEHLQLVAVSHLAGSVGDGGDAVAQEAGFGGDVHEVVGRQRLEAVAAREQEARGERYRERSSV